MPERFAGNADPLDAVGFDRAIGVLAADAADLWAVIDVETSGCGFLPDGRVKILFERHIFSRETGRRFDADHPAISNPRAGGYGEAGAGQYDRLEKAIDLDPHAALLATSWGLGQVMGFNAEVVGYAGVEDMVSSMADSESAQVEAMARFIVANHLDSTLRSHNWAQFARGYNGPNYRINNYDTRLAAEHDKVRRGAMPDLAVRAAQIYLTFLRYDPFGIDGIMGRLTRSALNQYQANKGFEMTDGVDEQTLERLAEDVRRLRTQV
jgi:hypothetical protein